MCGSIEIFSALLKILWWAPVCRAFFTPLPSADTKKDGLLSHTIFCTGEPHSSKDGDGFEVHYRDKECDVIYVSPAHMTKWGEIMPVKRRLQLVHLAAEKNSLVIEDDFENEFVYLQKPTPSLYGLSGGNNVIYLGSFSRLLLPYHSHQLYDTAAGADGFLYRKSRLLQSDSVQG